MPRKGVAVSRGRAYPPADECELVAAGVKSGLWDALRRPRWFSARGCATQGRCDVQKAATDLERGMSMVVAVAMATTLERRWLGATK